MKRLFVALLLFASVSLALAADITLSETLVNLSRRC